MLYNKNPMDSYKTSVIDTMVAEIQSVPGEDRCVLLLGYKDQMEEMFQVGRPRLLVYVRKTNATLDRMSTLDSLVDSRSRTRLYLRILPNPSSCKSSNTN